jgi:hypothetical protein
VKQAARTSVLASAWRHTWKHSPKLTLDIVAMCGDGGYRHNYLKPVGEELYRRRYVQRFIDTVDEVLRQRRGGGGAVEQLELRFDECHLRQVSSRLYGWIRFAVSSRAKSVRLHVSEAPGVVYGRDRYELPLQLLDAGGGLSKLEHISLSFVSLKVPVHAKSISFPNLNSLVLRLATVSTSDLQHMLSNCPNLERLDMHKVYLDDQLTVHRPLPRLLYLRLVDCRTTMIELHANSLKTFVFRGHSAPTIINLGGTSGLCNVNIQCFRLTLQQSVSSLPNSFPEVQRLCLCCTFTLPTLRSPVGNTPRFPHLKYLQLLSCIYPAELSNGILPIAYFLESAPFLEELDIKFVSSCKNGGEGPLRTSAQGQFEYKHLKRLRAREFTGQKDQLEIMMHIVENAPALEILTIDPIMEHVPATIDQVMEAETRSLTDIRRRATTFIGEKLLAKTKFVVV